MYNLNETHLFQRCRAEDPSLKTRFRPGSGRVANESPPHKRELKEKEIDENNKHKGRRKHRDAEGKYCFT